MKNRINRFPSAPLRRLLTRLDNENKPDERNSYTHATLQNENLVPSFTICTAFMVPLRLYTEFSFQFVDWQFSNQTEILFKPLHWTRVCVSKDSNTSLARLVVEGELEVEHEVAVNNQQDSLKLVLGSRTSPSSGKRKED